MPLHLKLTFLNMKKAFTTLLLLALTGICMKAQIPNGYYNNANGKTGDELKTALHDIIKGHHVISYGGLLNAFADTDCKSNGKIWDIYSNFEFDPTTGVCGEYEKEGDCWNREHTWPQSWFDPDNSENDTARTDLFHVYPTDGYVNGQRANYPYGEVINPTYTSGNGSKLGPCITSGYSGKVFEPIDDYKGDIARSYFYMSVRYYQADESWGTSDMTNKSEILPWAMIMLLRWNDEDPVSQKEIDRNNAVYAKQHNRNPFIDNPEYARMIWDPNWSGGVGGYEKVASTDEITNGDYLIVCENNGVVFNGALTTLDATGNTVGVTITGNVIASSTELDAALFTITAKTGGYSIKSVSGYYIGNTGDVNALKSSQNDEYVNMISFTDGNADIVSNSSHLRYNASSGQTRFRYFKSSTYTNQQAIQLYKRLSAYSITLASVEYGRISASANEAVEGTTITLTATPDEGYDLDVWTVTDAANNPVEVDGNQFVMPASNVTVSATFVQTGIPYEQKYYLVTSTDQLVAGRTYLIVNTQAGKALSTTQNTNNRAATSVTIEEGVIASIENTVCELILGGSTGAWTFFDANWGDNGGYLFAASSSSNNLKTQANNNANGTWAISIDNDGMANIVAQGSNTRNNLRYNPNGSNPIFSCYASTSTMAKVELFVRSEEFEYPENTTLTCLNTFDKHVVHSGATLTASNVFGTTLCTQPNNLILEDSAQLIHNAEGVQATVKKGITAYTGDGGWYTIAAPFSAYTPTGGMIEGNYDLYAYDEDGGANGKEWVNYEAGSFNLTANNGYLYANAASKSLRMGGVLNSGTYSSTVNLSYGNDDADIKGFNLLGNPVAHDINFSKTEQVSDGYYYLDNSDSWVYTTESSVPVGRGFLVKANAENQTVTLNPQSKGDRGEKGQYICLSIGDEKVYVKLNEGVSMPLMDLKGHHAGLYLLSEHKPYAMLVRGEANAIDLCFEPRRDGIKTLSVDTEGLELDYLHLIDNKTGADVDLLVTPNYSFEAIQGDYATRFRLMFDVCGDTDVDNEHFAYYANGEICLVVETCHGASLQVLDMTGRVLVCRDAACHVSTNGMAPGVYVLRLVTDDNVRVQKIVVK